jgi:PIN domain nuclease of toxin-antitoxin system
MCEDKLSKIQRECLSNPENVAWVSIVSLWELAIKEAIGKIRLPKGLFASIQQDGYQILSLTLTHVEMMRKLPLIHRDPFDRMLVAQAQAEQLILATLDTEMLQYPVSTLR